MLSDIIKYLDENLRAYQEISAFSTYPGIYAISYLGSDFPVLGKAVKINQIVYIGKTESSQESRDQKTHFSSGKTGSSTVRKSIGALLCESRGLNPIPRNNSDYSKGRLSHFKFDDVSEERLTHWMKNNLALSFYEFSRGVDELDALETEIIRQIRPVLNIDHKNPNNPFAHQIKQLRKTCAVMAFKDFDQINLTPDNSPTKSKATSPVDSHTSGSNVGSIIIDNITEKDVVKKLIRIKVTSKYLLPSEIIGKPVSHELSFYIDDIKFIAKYKIGSKDGKSRSGRLYLGNEGYDAFLKIKPNKKLIIEKQTEDTYRIKTNP